MRIAKKNHHRVADELVYGAAELRCNTRHLRKIAIEQAGNFFWLPPGRGFGEIFDIGEKYGEFFTLGVDFGLLRAFKQRLVNLRRQITREFFRQRLQAPGAVAALQMRLNPRHQHRRADRFGDVVDSAEVKA